MTQNQPQNQPQNKPPVDNRSASQKIADLENAVMSTYQTLDNVIKDLGTIKDAIKLLGNKVDSIVKASVNGEAISDAVLARIMIENNCEELANKVKVMIAQGVLAPQEQVGDNSFIVGAELNDAGETVNPRLQFGIFALRPELQEKLKGSKPGDVINLEEGKLKFKVLETHAIQQPKENAPAPLAPASTDAAPAAAPLASAGAPAAPAALAPVSSDAAPAAPAADQAPQAAPVTEQAAPQA